MSKKILLLFFFLALAAFMLSPKADAATTHVYVGVQVAAASAPGYGGAIDYNWCLPGGTNGTQITIMGGTGCTAINNGSNFQNCSDLSVVNNSGTTNPSSATLSPSCASGNIIWSGLLNLTTGTQYVIKLTTANFCPGSVSGSICYITAASESCNDACSYYGLQPDTPNCDIYALSNCDTIARVKGSLCANCYPTTSAPFYSRYNVSTNDCYYAYYGYYSDCNASPSPLVRICSCSYTSGASDFYFNFTLASF